MERFPQFQRRKLHLSRSPAAKDVNIGNRRGFQALVDVLGDVGRQQVFGALHKNSRDIECDISIANHGYLFGIQWPLEWKVRMGVIPVHKVGSSVATR